MNAVKAWADDHPALWEFILFNVLSNCATVTNFIVVWICTGFVFRALSGQAFQFLIFNYTNVEHDLGLCGFLSFLTATACAQTVNFFVQRNFVFKSNADFSRSVPKYIILAVLLVIISAALPAYSQDFLADMGMREGLVPTLANAVNIVVQVVISFPLMKFWIMPETQ